MAMAFQHHIGATSRDLEEPLYLNVRMN